MSEDWPSGWYRDDPRQRPEPRYAPNPGADASPYEPTQAVPPRSAWNTAEARQFLHDLATDQVLPKSLISGANVSGTT
jgi:hypothetical protein